MVEYQGKETPGPQVKWAGAYSASVRYRPGASVSSGGSTYLCLRTCKAVTPGSDSTAWIVYGSGPTGATGSTGATGAAGPAAFPAFTTVGRPAHGAAGNIYYDTTLGLPGFSNGTVWKDAAGNTI